MSNIEWTDETWNPVTGCSKISPGCAHCYAERMAKRLAGRFGYPADDPFSVTLHSDRLKQPLRWRKPRRVFVCSMGDLFHDDVSDETIDKVFAVMLACHFFEDRPDHVFQVLTKRHERMHAYMQARTPAEHLRAWSQTADGWIHMANPDELLSEAVEWYCSAKWSRETGLATSEVSPWSCPENTFPLPGVWIGVTAENQAMANERIPALLRTPAVIRFVSVEPMLGPVDLLEACWGSDQRLDWVICGGESGPGARPMHPEWARGLRDQCTKGDISFFFKQWGEWSPNYYGEPSWEPTDTMKCHYFDDPLYKVWRCGKGKAGRLLDGREWNEMPGGESG